MKRVEIESFIKSFLLFFISLSSVICFLNYQTHNSQLHELEDTLFAQMQITSLSKDTQGFTKNIISKQDDMTLNIFYSDKENLFVLFKNMESNNSVIKVSYPLENVDFDESIIFERSLKRALKSLAVIFILSIAFSLYALYPFKKYLNLTEEFIKDILHDFNTPISTMRLNISSLKEKSDNKNLQRIEGGIDTILNLQDNLKEYLEGDIKESESFNVKEMIIQRVEYMQGVFPNIYFKTDIADKIIYCYKDGFIRIIDNILSNACKYNKRNGSVIVVLKEDMILNIQDTGNGIKNPKKIFKRFYKETSRGLGIGLHLVKKLSKKMKIPLHVDSKLGIGTTFKLNLTSLIHN